jgi:protein subunit release factor B
MSKELLFSITKDDFIWEFFRAGGKGGQHQNKTDSACRCTHIDSGSVGESREERVQSQNRKIAFKRCISTDKFKLWHRMKCAELMSGETVNQKLEKAMDNRNIITEVRKDGKWTKVSLEELLDE